MGQILTPALLSQRMHAAQDRWEQPPELADDDELTADEAQEQAEAELLTTAEPLADWIAKGCDCDAGRDPINVHAVEDIDIADTDSIPLLLAAIVGGFRCQQGAAIERLRTLYLRAERASVDARAAQLLSGGAS